MSARDAPVPADQRSRVERARQGDHECFALLARGAVRRLHGGAYAILRDQHLAEDAVQEALVRAWRDLPGLRDPDKFDAWLHRMLVHACIDLVRRRRRQVTEVRLEWTDGPSRVDISSELADREALDAALRALDPKRRALVVGHVMLGMPVPDLAAALGIPLGSAKSGLHRALASMRLEIDDERAGVGKPAGELR